MHALLKSAATQPAALSLLESQPLAAQEVGKAGLLPLHEAARRRAPAEIVAAIVAAFPRGAAQPDDKGWLPLHWACDRKAPAEVVDLLLGSHPDGASHADGEGRLPLHLAAAAGSASEMTAVVQLLLASRPDAASIADAHGRLPLHYAAARRAPAGAVAQLLGAHPAAAAAADGDGQTPAQLAVAHQAAPDVLALLRASAAAPSLAAGPAAPSSSAAVSAPALLFNASLGAHNAWEVEVPTSVVDEARAIFEAAELGRAFEEVRTSPDRHRSLSCERGEADGAGRFFLIRAGGLEHGHGGWRSDVAWISVDDEATHRTFERLFSRLGLADAFLPRVEHDVGLRMYSAFYVVRSRCEAPNFHVDYSREVGVRALTLMTPLDDYEETAAFQLLYEEASASTPEEDGEERGGEERGGEERGGNEPTAGVADRAKGAPRPLRRYIYRKGRAIVFGASFRHSTEPGTSRCRERPHVYLCFTFGTDRPEHWPAIAATIDGYQSRVLARPDGSFVLSKLGRKLEEERGARGAGAGGG